GRSPTHRTSMKTTSEFEKGKLWVPVTPRKHQGAGKVRSKAKQVLELDARILDVKEALGFRGKWKELENIILSEVTQTQKDKHGLPFSLSRLKYWLLVAAMLMKIEGLLHKAQNGPLSAFPDLCA
ncbi:hypothetical protein STEG23_004240, partial [Scotinomys teguina]